MKVFIWILALAVIVALGLLFYWRIHFSSPSSSTTVTGPSSSTVPIANATYSCDNGHVIRAAFYQGPTMQPQPGQPPVPNGSVEVRLDGGPVMTLAQTISADGARYSDGAPQIPQGQPGAESFVFWNKGDTALIMHNNAMDLIYTNCTAPQK